LFIYTFLFTFLGLAFIYSTARLDSFKKEITKTIDFSSSQRFSLYNSSIKLIIDNPIFGVGPGNWRIKIWEYDLYFNTFGDSFAQRPHNDFLWVFSEGGLIAGLSYLLLFLILLRDSYFLSKNSKNAKNNFLFKLIFCVLIGYGFVSMLDFPLERFSHLIIFFLIAAIVISERIRNENLQIFYIPLWIKGFLFALCIFSVYIGFIRYNGEVNVTNALKFKKRNKLVSVVKAINKGYSSNFYDIEGTSTPLLWYRGLAYYKMGKYDLALNDFKSSYDVNPNHIHVLNNLATSYDMLGDYKKAKEFYNKALKVNPTFKEARVNLAAIIYNDKDYLTALDVILESKVDLHWRRVRDNDNYDLYLKTIFQAWANKEMIDLDNNNKEILNSLIVYFEEYPASAERKLRAVFNKKIELGINYIQSLLIIEEEIKSHTKFKY
jgi:tetratricopeptide (TPR) repeat protein